MNLLTISRVRIPTLHVIAAVVMLGALAAPASGQFTRRVSLAADGSEPDNQSAGANCSADGRFIAFGSGGSNLVAGDFNGVGDVFVKDLRTGAIERVSVDSSGVEANDGSGSASISPDGNFVVFLSGATNLVAGDTNGQWDVFLHDRTLRTTVRVNVAGATQANKQSSYPSVAANGTHVVFMSDATNLVPGDLNKKTDVFVADMAAGTIDRVSVDTAGGDADGYAWRPSISDDGVRVAFASDATDLVSGDTNKLRDVFVRDRAAGVTLLASVDSSGVHGNFASDWPWLSGDGDVVAFQSAANNLVANDTNTMQDVFVHVLSSGLTERVNVDSWGNQSTWYARDVVISGDGSRVAFASSATDLVSNDLNGVQDVFVRDRTTGITFLASLHASGAQGTIAVEKPTIAAGGGLVLFEGYGDFDGSDAGWDFDVWARATEATDATWTSYGAGLPGLLGVPTLVALSDPALGVQLDVALGNSAGFDTTAFLILGFARAAIPFKSGTLLVDLASILALPLPVAGLVIGATLPDDPALDGLLVDLQAIELDPAAAQGLSFSAGLELRLGW